MRGRLCEISCWLTSGEASAKPRAVCRMYAAAWGFLPLLKGRARASVQRGRALAVMTKHTLGILVSLHDHQMTMNFAAA